MGRAIVREPAAFLMDEPLSNLDAKLRVQMRAEVSRIQRRVGVATIYVTHDQIEAMTMGDRVAVMRAGRLQQCDAPQNALRSPREPVRRGLHRLARDEPLQATRSTSRTRACGSATRRWTSRRSCERELAGWPAGREVVVGIRPEDLTDAAVEGQDGTGRYLEGTVDLVEELGAEKLVHFHIDASRIHGRDARIGIEEEEADESGLEAGEIGAEMATAGVARVAPSSRIKTDEKAVFRVATERMHLFDPESGESLTPHNRAPAQEAPRSVREDTTPQHETPPQAD